MIVIFFCLTLLSVRISQAVHVWQINIDRYSPHMQKLIGIRNHSYEWKRVLTSKHLIDTSPRSINSWVIWVFDLLMYLLIQAMFLTS